MTKLQSLTMRFYSQVVLKRPVFIIVCLLALVCLLAFYAKNLRLDASAETLVMEDDKDLLFARLISSRYAINDFLLVTVTPTEDLFSESSLKIIGNLQKDLEGLDGVASVVSILNTPLLESPPMPVKELVKNIQTLRSPAVDKDLAQIEFRESPLYQNLLVSPDLKSTALLINFPIDTIYRDLMSQRDKLREKASSQRLSREEKDTLIRIKSELRQHRDAMKNHQHRMILKIRDIMDQYRQDAELFIGGVSMVADDLISFIKSDLKVFGFGIFFFLIGTLGILFKKIRWILLPTLCCFLSVLAMIGILGFFGWEVTVISSNFISLQLIITLAITLHLVVRYRELHGLHPHMDQKTLVLETVKLKLKPCIYAALTTIAGFVSLLLCDIKPVITFGWMMTAGILVSLVLTFLLFPAGLSLIKKAPSQKRHVSQSYFLSFLARLTERHGNFILIVSFVTLIFSMIGIQKLEVENSFIDYFKKSTEIYQGMKVIDQKLGGTTPLDIIIDLEEDATSLLESPETDSDEDEAFSAFEEFDAPVTNNKYWFTNSKMEKVLRVHNYLDAVPETGKILSLGTMVKIAEKLNDNKPLDNFQLALLYSEIPDEYKEMLIKPYVSVEHNQLRFSARVRDSEKSLRRNALLKRIRHDLVNKLGFKEKNVHLTGMLVLYNNMLQSLFQSQVLTLGVVLIALMIMFLILFRSVKIALIAIFPNVLSIGVVLGMMGWLKIPLDMMTITIASISVGIAVDNTIHYIDRFKAEIQSDGDYIQAMHRCHRSIGYAMYYTSITIIVGFSILVLSNFIPSIYFGILTGLAMLIALIAALTLLPQLLIVAKPFKKQNC
jgi:uncharacterized protein